MYGSDKQLAFAQDVIEKLKQTFADGKTNPADAKLYEIMENYYTNYVLTSKKYQNAATVIHDRNTFLSPGQVYGYIEWAKLMARSKGAPSTPESLLTDKVAAMVQAEKERIAKQKERFRRAYCVE